MKQIRKRRLTIIIVGIVVISMSVLGISINMTTNDAAAHEVADEMDTQSEGMDIEIDVQVPFNGIQGGTPNQNIWTEVEVTVQNGQSPLEGDVYLIRELHQGQEDILIRQQLSMAAHAEATFTFDLPVVSVDHLLLRVETDEGTLEELAPFDLERDHQRLQMGLISDEDIDPSSWRGMDGVALEPHVFAAAELPRHPWLIPMQIMVMDEDTHDGLSSEQEEVVHRWVLSGGTLILAEQSPAFTEHEQGEASYYFPEQENPLIVCTKSGSGSILRADWDLWGEHIGSISAGMEQWEEAFSFFQVMDTVYAQHEYEQRINHIFNHSQSIPGVEPPSVGMAATIWMIYVLVVGPILYIVLKRMGKREWAWGIIPLIAILTAACVYIIGMNRMASESSTHVVTHIHIQDEEWAKIDMAASLLMRQGGDYSVRVNEPMRAAPQGWWIRYDHVADYAQAVNGNRYLQYTDVPYMSVKHAMGMGYTSDMGYIGHDLYVQDHRLIGRLVNHTRHHLEDIILRIGENHYEVKAMEAGQTREIDIDLGRNRGVHDPEDPLKGHDMGHDPIHIYHDHSHAYHHDFSREMGEEHAYPPYHQRHGEPVLTFSAKSDEGMDVLTVEDRSVNEHYSHYIYQEMTLGPDPNGVMTYPHGLLPVSVAEITGDVDAYRNDEFIVYSGQVVFDLHASPPGIDVQHIDIAIGEAPFSPFDMMIWNIDEEVWEEVPAGKSYPISAENMDQYVAEDGVVTLRAENRTSEPYQLPYPTFKVQGEVQE